MGGESPSIFVRLMAVMCLTLVLGACESRSDHRSSQDMLHASSTEEDDLQADFDDPGLDDGDQPANPDSQTDPDQVDPEPQPEPDPQPDPDPDPQPEAEQPEVQFTVSDNAISNGSSALLSWTSTNADSCSASGGWSGAKSTQGQESTGALSTGTTFTLRCSGAGGNAMTMVSVDITALLEVAWQAPSEDVNGNPVTPLDSYEIFYGANPGDYEGSVEVPGNATSHAIETLQGNYYVAMSVTDIDGMESGLSAEVLLATQ